MEEVDVAGFYIAIAVSAASAKRIPAGADPNSCARVGGAKVHRTFSLFLFAIRREGDVGRRFD